MSKIKSCDKNFYPSIADGIHEIMNMHLITQTNKAIYSVRALDDVCFFLAENDIQHSYSAFRASNGEKYDEIISLVWMESGVINNEIWYSRGNSREKPFYVKLTVFAEEKEKVDGWLEFIADNSPEDIKVVNWIAEEE